MIISTIIMTICFVVVVFEVFSAFVVLRSCRKVRCSTVTSKKVSVREDGYLVKEYWDTAVGFELDGTKRTANLETSTFCQKGQTIGAYYYPKKNLVFRKRDVKRVLRSYSIPAFSVGMLFLLLDLIFTMTSLGSILISHLFEIAAVILIITLTSIGGGFMIYSVSAMRHTRSERVIRVDARVTDVIRRSKRHGDKTRFYYYPVFSYSIGDFEHNVTSRLARETPPETGSTESVLADKKKGSLVEYKDGETSFILGICLIMIAILLFMAITNIK